MSVQASRYVFVCMLSLLVLSNAAAEDINVGEILIHPLGDNARTKYGVTHVESSEIEKRQTQTVADILRNVVGLDVARLGGAGQPSSVFIRGAKAEHTLVLIDGIEANDPTTTTRFFDFSTLTLDNIERIEVFRGARSTRFGADAIGGVINIVTKKGDGKTGGHVSGEVGSFETRRAGGQIGGSLGTFGYSVGLSQVTSVGFSAADAGPNDEADGLRRTSFSSRLDWSLAPQTDAIFTARVIDAATSLDSSGGPAGDDPNYDSTSRQVLTGLTLKARDWLPNLESSIGAYLNSTNRRYDNLPHPGSTTESHEAFDSEGTKFETNHRVRLAKSERSSTHVTVGAQYRQEVAASNRQTVAGELALLEFQNNEVELELGVRHDQISISEDSILNGSASAAYKVASLGVTLAANYGTGFKSPSLFQLHSIFGSRGLRAERAATWDFSIEKRLASVGSVTATYFQNAYSNLIDFDMAVSKYANVSKAKSGGFELQGTVFLFTSWTARLGAKLLSTRDELTGLELLRRPRFASHAALAYSFEKWDVEANYGFVGDRDDIDPVLFGRIRMASYDVVGFTVKYMARSDIAIHARIDNLTDQTYYDVAGYRTSRRALYAGLEGNF